MDLEDLRGQELAEFGNIFPMLKNVSRVKAFGPLKDPVEAAINPIDSIIAYARHNALEMYDEGQLENLLKSIASRLSRNDLSANKYSNKFVDEESIHHVGRLCFRDRLYYVTGYFNPQGTDLAKALHLFSNKNLIHIHLVSS